MNGFFLGVAFLALQHLSFPCDRAMDVYRRIDRPAIAFLWGTFGTNMSCLRKFDSITGEKKKHIHVYLLNGVCIRKKNCGRGELFRSWSLNDWERALAEESPRLKRAVMKRTRRVRKELAPYFRSNVSITLAAMLESNLNHEALQTLVEWIRKEWPHAIVINPMSMFDGFGTRRVWWELHGKYPLGDICSWDGTDIDFDHRRADLPEAVDERELKRRIRFSIKSGCRRLFMWWGRQQGLTRDSRVAPKPRKRRIRITRSDALAVNDLLRGVQNEIDTTYSPR